MFSICCPRCSHPCSRVAHGYQQPTAGCSCWAANVMNWKLWPEPAWTCLDHNPTFYRSTSSCFYVARLCRKLLNIWAEYLGHMKYLIQKPISNLNCLCSHSTWNSSLKYAIKRQINTNKVNIHSFKVKKKPVQKIKLPGWLNVKIKK